MGTKAELLFRSQQQKSTPAVEERSNPPEEPLEPFIKLVFSDNGTGEQEMSLSEVERRVTITKDQIIKLKRLAAHPEKSWRKHGGRLRSRPEMADVREGRGDLKNRIKRLQGEGDLWQRILNLAQTSSPDLPLEIEVREMDVQVFLDGKRLSPNEVEWRECVGEHAPELWHHEQIGFLKEYYFLRRDAYEEAQAGFGQKNRQKLDQFSSRQGKRLKEDTVNLLRCISERFSLSEHS